MRTGTIGAWVRIDPAHPAAITLTLTRVLPAVATTADTRWVKRFRITSRLASAFWGHEMPLGAVVLLPKGYEANPAMHYPVVYTIGHYSDRPPFAFTFDGCGQPESAKASQARLARDDRPRGGRTDARGRLRSPRLPRTELDHGGAEARRQAPCGGWRMDNFFLNLGVYRFETFLESTKEPGKEPYYAGTFQYGRPLKPHGWQPWTNQELPRIMLRQVEANAPRP